jgi:tRNA-binding EMAP/Myf-like protein
VPDVVVGLILEVRDHPAGTRDRVAVVDTGAYGGLMHRTFTVVFGGTRQLAAGDLVPVALPGAHARVDGRWRRTRARTYRGVRSEAMLCSLDKLGWMDGGPDEVATFAGVEPGRPVRVER